MPTVSVIMPVYNAGRFLAPAVESVLRQTFTDFELIAIDDGSTDGSLGVLQDFAAKDPRVRLVSRPNQGICRTRNEALGMALGEFVAPLDNDDVAMPDRFARQVGFLLENPDVVVVGGAFELIDADDVPLTVLTPPEGDEEIQRQALAGHCSIIQTGSMIRRDVLREAGAWDPEFETAEDIELWLRLGERGRLANLPDVTVRYRIFDRSASDSSRQRGLGRRACERAWARRGIAGHYEATGDWRPGRDRRSRHEFSVLYGWWAFNNGARRASLKYGLRAVRAMPLRPGGWRLLACSVLKPAGG